MTPHEQRIERIHNAWRKASAASRLSIQRYQSAVDGSASPAERKHLARRAKDLCKRAHNLAMAEVQAVFQRVRPKPTSA